MSKFSVHHGSGYTEEDSFRTSIISVENKKLDESVEAEDETKSGVSSISNLEKR